MSGNGGDGKGLEIAEMRKSGKDEGSSAPSGFAAED